MNIIISTSIDKPLHVQIADCIRAEVLSGRLQAEEPLPSIRQLALDLGVSVITVKNAYEALQAEGFIYSFPSKGFYVSPLSEEKIKAIKESILKKTLERQMEYLEKMGLSKDDVISALQKEEK